MSILPTLVPSTVFDLSQVSKDFQVIPAEPQTCSECIGEHLTAIFRRRLVQICARRKEDEAHIVTPGRPLAINYYQNITYFNAKANELSTSTSRTVLW
jgi:hypothetical protein